MSDIAICFTVCVVVVFIWLFLFTRDLLSNPYIEEILDRNYIYRPDGVNCYRQDITILRKYKNGKEKIYIKSIHY